MICVSWDQCRHWYNQSVSSVTRLWSDSVTLPWHLTYMLLTVVMWQISADIRCWHCYDRVSSATRLWCNRVTLLWRLTDMWQSSADTMSWRCYMPQLGTDSWRHITTTRNLHTTHFTTQCQTDNALKMPQKSPSQATVSTNTTQYKTYNVSYADHSTIRPSEAHQPVA